MLLLDHAQVRRTNKRPIQKADVPIEYGNRTSSAWLRTALRGLTLLTAGRAFSSLLALLLATAYLWNPAVLFAQDERKRHAGGEANLLLPDLSQARFFGGLIDGRSLLLYGLIVVALGLLFGLVIYRQLKHLPVHRSMLEISELIYETCKTYLVTQAKFLLILELFIGTIIVF